jgi:hypothetical protein
MESRSVPKETETPQVSPSQAAGEAKTGEPAEILSEK